MFCSTSSLAAGSMWANLNVRTITAGSLEGTCQTIRNGLTLMSQRGTSSPLQPRLSATETFTATLFTKEVS